MQERRFYFHKIFKKKSSKLLFRLIPNQYTRYAETQKTFLIAKLIINISKNSFFPQLYKERNKLDSNILFSESLNVFNKVLKFI